MCDCCNNLLYALSSRQELNWATFKELVEGFYPRMAHEHSGLQSVDELRRHVVRTLDLLGHCEFSFECDERRVYISPPVLALLPNVGQPKAILCGARSPRTLSTLEEAGASGSFSRKVSFRRQSLGGNTVCAPDRLSVIASDSKTLMTLADKLGYRFSETPPAWPIVYFAGSLESFLSSCVWSNELSLNWRRWDFDLGRLVFSSQHVDSPLLSRYEDPVRFTQRYYLQYGNHSAQVDLDWGRYAALHLAQVNVLAYDEVQELFVVPCGASLPRLFARALGLCSGYAPLVVNYTLPAIPGTEGQPSCYVFKEVPPVIAFTLAKKLGQSLICRSVKL